MSTYTLPLTNRQALALVFIADYIAAHNYPPTLAEIGEAVDSPAPSKFVAALRQKGWIAPGDRRRRSLELTQHGAERIESIRKQLGSNDDTD